MLVTTTYYDIFPNNKQCMTGVTYSIHSNMSQGDAINHKFYQAAFTSGFKYQNGLKVCDCVEKEVIYVDGEDIGVIDFACTIATETTLPELLPDICRCSIDLRLQVGDRVYFELTGKEWTTQRCTLEKRPEAKCNRMLSFYAKYFAALTSSTSSSPSVSSSAAAVSAEDRLCAVSGIRHVVMVFHGADFANVGQYLHHCDLSTAYVYLDLANCCAWQHRTRAERERARAEEYRKRAEESRKRAEECRKRAEESRTRAEEFRTRAEQICTSAEHEHTIVERLRRQLLALGVTPVE